MPKLPHSRFCRKKNERISYSLMMKNVFFLSAIKKLSLLHGDECTWIGLSESGRCGEEQAAVVIERLNDAHLCPLSNISLKVSKAPKYTGYTQAIFFSAVVVAWSGGHMQGLIDMGIK
uniref:Uncharacterized protein n=1 Tax=Parascaris univalens TaxID=6257 RepID=A0A915BB68_PARUN